jgi:hypothetical protein
MDGTLNLILADDLYARLGTASAPTAVDVRRCDAFNADDRVIVSASVDTLALTQSLAAAIAIFRFRIGMMPTLTAWCAAGVVHFLLGVTAATHGIGMRGAHRAAPFLE